MSGPADKRRVFSGTAFLEQFHCYRPPPPLPTSAELCQALPAIPTTATVTSHDTSDFDLYTSIKSVTTSSYVPDFLRSRMLQASAARTSVKPSSIPISTKPRMSTHASSSSTATKPRHRIKHIPDTETTTESTEVKSESDLFSYLDLTTYDAVTDALKGKVRPEHMPYNAMKTELYARIRHFKQYGHDIIRPAKVTLDHAPPSLYRRGRKNKRLRKFWIKID